MAYTIVKNKKIFKMKATGMPLVLAKYRSSLNAPDGRCARAHWHTLASRHMHPHLDVASCQSPETLNWNPARALARGVC